MRYNFLIIIFLTAISFTFFSCEDDPASIGSNLIPIGDLPSFIVFSSDSASITQSSSFYRDTLNLGASERVLVGSAGDLKISALLRFLLFLPDSIKNAIEADSLNVLESWLEIIPNYTLGEGANVPDFEVYSINSDWRSTNFNLDSLSHLSIDQTNIKTSQTDNDSIYSIKLSASVTEPWLKNLSDTSLQKHYGIQLKITEASNKILGFQGLTFSPTDPEPALKYVVQKPGAFTDTLSFEVGADTHIFESDFPAVQDDIVLQGGFASRGKLKFDLSSIPKSANIVLAELELKIDESQTVQGDPASNIVSVAMFDSTGNKVLEVTSLPLTKNDLVFKGKITQFVQRWLLGVENFGMRLNLTDELKSAAKVSFFGSNADAGLRPKLIVTYSLQ